VIKWLLTAGKFVGGAISTYRLWIGLGVVVVLISGLVLYVHGAEQAKARVPELLARVVRVETAARQNQNAFEQCNAANQANAMQAVIQREKVRQSQIQIAALKAAADARVEPITREAEALRGRGLECPALDSDFRRWVLSQ
jgi:hypothetical protein